MLNNLLIYRMLLVNFCLFLVLGYLASKGTIQYVFANDHSGITYVITGIFTVGLVGTFHRAIKTSKALNQLKEYSIENEAPVWLKNNVAKMPVKNAYLHTIMNILTGLGIIGTTIGMAAMLGQMANMSQDAIVHGASIAFMCTLVGLSTAIWTEINVRMLDTATNLLVKDVE